MCDSKLSFILRKQNAITVAVSLKNKINFHPQYEHPLCMHFFQFAFAERHEKEGKLIVHKWDENIRAQRKTIAALYLIMKSSQT